LIEWIGIALFFICPPFLALHYWLCWQYDYMDRRYKCGTFKDSWRDYV